MVYSHGDVEEDGEEELVVDGHGDEPALVELGRRLPHHDAQPDAPQQEQELHCHTHAGKEGERKEQQIYYSDTTTPHLHVPSITRKGARRTADGSLWLWCQCFPDGGTQP